MATQRWTFEDLSLGDTYEFAVNPNTGGSAVPEKSMNVETRYSVETNGVLAQGPWDAPGMRFSGVILTQAQDEAMEKWALRETTLKVTDDLERVIVGVLSEFSRTRSRRINNPWFSTYDAVITVLSQTNATGVPTWNEVSA